MAQLGLHVFRRVSDNDRERLGITSWSTSSQHPNPATPLQADGTSDADLGIYYSAHWLKLRGGPTLGLARIPPEEMEPDGWLAPRAFYWTMPDGMVSTVAPEDVVHISGYSPFNPIQGLAPIETLRRLLCETAASNDYREAFWRNSARLEGVITCRPAPRPDARTETIVPANSGRRATAGNPVRSSVYRGRHDVHAHVAIGAGVGVRRGPEADPRGVRGRVSHSATDGRHPRSRDLQQREGTAQAGLSGHARTVVSVAAGGDRTRRSCPSATTS